MHELDKYFLHCLEAERARMAKEIEDSSRALWPPVSLVKRIKKLLTADHVLSHAIDGPGGAVSSLKAAARGNEHAERVRKLLVLALLNTDNVQDASRRVLKDWIGEWAQKDLRWQRAPIRFYHASNALAPCLTQEGTMLNKKEVLSSGICCQFNATWLWGNYCVYAWHRWTETAIDLKALKNMLAACEKAHESIYKDHQPRFLFIVHGPGSVDARALPCPPNARIVAPWEITHALSSMGD